MLRLSPDGDQRTTVNQLALQARFRPRAFEKCSALQQLNFERAEYDPNLNRDMPEGCFFEAGMESLFLPADFNWMGPAVSIAKGCKQLTSHKPILVKFWGAPLHTACSCMSSVPHQLCCALTNQHLLAARNCACSSEREEN